MSCEKKKYFFFVLSLGFIAMSSVVYANVPKNVSKQDILLLNPSKKPFSSQRNASLPNFQTPLNITSEEEKQAGRLFFISVQHYAVLNNDPVLQQYIHDLGNLLVNYANIVNPNYVFFIIDEASINAFAGPAGYIGIHSGLILSASSEGEIASVLAHEIAHTKQQHLHRLIENQTNNYTNPLVIFGLLLAGIATQSPYVIPGVLVLQGKRIENAFTFLRQFENEADTTGLQILQNAGFSGQYALLFMERLLKKDFSSDSSEYLRTHPLTRKRISNLQNQVVRRELYSPPSEFVLIQARLSYLSKLPTERRLNLYQKKYVALLSALRQNDHQKATTIWQQLPPHTKEKSLLFNLLYMRLLLNDNQINKAQQQINKLRYFYPNHLQVLRLQTELYLKKNNVQQAERNILQYTDNSTYNLYQSGLWNVLEDLYFRERKKTQLFYAKAQKHYHLGFLRKALEYLDRAIKFSQAENKNLGQINQLKSIYNYWHKQLYATSHQDTPSPHQ